MSEPIDPFAAMMGSLAAQAQQLGAQITEASRPVTWEYKLVSWDEVNPLARDGWELKGMDVGALRFVMGRQRGAADEAADMLAAASADWTERHSGLGTAVRDAVPECANCQHSTRKHGVSGCYFLMPDDEICPCACPAGRDNG